MKRILALAIAAVLLLSGCGGKEDTSGDAKKPAADQATADVTLNGVELDIGGELTAEDKADLGQPVSTSEAPSCLYEGMDVIYEYDGFTLQTNQQSKNEIVCIVTITDTAYTTDKGIKIGDTIETVTKAYGAATDESLYYLVYAYDGYDLTLNLSDGTVDEIQYQAVEK